MAVSLDESKAHQEVYVVSQCWGMRGCAQHSKSATCFPPLAQCLREFRGFKKCFRLIFGHAGSFLLHMDFLWLWRAGATTLHCGAWASHCGPLLLESSGSGVQVSVTPAHRFSCPLACGIFPGQESNPRPLHWQADS